MRLRAERFRVFSGTGEATFLSTLVGAEEFLRRVADRAAVGWLLALVDVLADGALPTFHTRKYFIKEVLARGKLFPESPTPSRLKGSAGSVPVGGARHCPPRPATRIPRPG